MSFVDDLSFTQSRENLSDDGGELLKTATWIEKNALHDSSSQQDLTGNTVWPTKAKTQSSALTDFDRVFLSHSARLTLNIGPLRPRRSPRSYQVKRMRKHYSLIIWPRSTGLTISFTLLPPIDIWNSLMRGSRLTRSRKPPISPCSPQYFPSRPTFGLSRPT